MMDLMRCSHSRVPSNCLMDQTMEMHGAKPALFCNFGVATVTLSFIIDVTIKCKRSSRIKIYFDDEVLMELMRCSGSCMPSHFLMDQAMDMHDAKPMLFLHI